MRCYDFIPVYDNTIKSYDNMMFGCIFMAWDKQMGHFGSIFALLPPWGV